MGTCTSTARHRQKQHNRNIGQTKNSTKFVNQTPPPLPPLPSIAFPKQSQSLYSDFDLLSSLKKTPIFHQTDTNSLIQLYSSNTNYNNNNNNNNNHYMSSTTSSTVAHMPPRIPVPKTRVPVYQPPVVTLRPKTNVPTHQTGTKKFDFFHIEQLL